MISVIVPVYNVEPYLRKCLDSIVGQTYRDLEILVVDDGSTDGSGAICDEYKVDERVRVFHTKNRGLSAARNKGLDEAKGEWIGFVDSDDWIEPDMYEVLLRKAEETGADVVECGVFVNYHDSIVERRRQDAVLSGREAIQLLLKQKISNAVWNKIWKRKHFDQTHFPEGRNFEDITMTYQVFLSSEKVCTVTYCGYHYLQRIDSLSRRHNIKNMMDSWLSHSSRYKDLMEYVSEEEQTELLKFCAKVASRAWIYYFDYPEWERVIHYNTFREINTFITKHIPLFGFKGWKLKMRLGIIFPHYLKPISFRMAWFWGHIYRTIMHLYIPKRDRLKDYI